ncbi:hypothetical protein ACFLY2_02825 [Patescibacteria group bacterium]
MSVSHHDNLILAHSNSIVQVHEIISSSGVQSSFKHIISEIL